MKKVVGMIPIKLKNQRLPGKNTLPLGNRVLCQYLFETVKNISVFEDIYVFCSDESIKQYLPEEIKFLARPKELDQDEVKSKQILDCFVDMVPADIYALMHVTQPFITENTIVVSINKVLNENFDSAFAAHAVKEFIWFEGKPLNYGLHNVVRTQELEPVYVEGELFVFERKVLKEYGRRIGKKPYIHPITWKESICIDEKDDFEMAEAVLELEMKNKK